MTRTAILVVRRPWLQQYTPYPIGLGYTSVVGTWLTKAGLRRRAGTSGHLRRHVPFSRATCRDAPPSFGCYSLHRTFNRRHRSAASSSGIRRAAIIRATPIEAAIKAA